MIIAWLLKFLGLKGMVRTALLLMKWAVRLVVLVLLVIAAVLVLHNVTVESFGIIAGAAVVGFVIYRAWQQGNRGMSEAAGPVERTIDGKVVPDKLAVAALDMPQFSQGYQGILRGLPDYGKVLLKLDIWAFEYVPPPPEPLPKTEPPPKIEPPPKAETATAPPIGALKLWLHQLKRAVKSGGSEMRPSHGLMLFGLILLVLLIGGAVNSRQTVPSAETSATPALGAQSKVTPAMPATPPKNDGAATFTPSAPPTSYSTPTPLGAMPESSQRPTGGLLWAKEDNGPEPIKSLEAATAYCASLNLDGLAGWRVPSSDDIKEGAKTHPVVHLSLHPTEYIWISDISKEAIPVGPPLPPEANKEDYFRAICVHDGGT